MNLLGNIVWLLFGGFFAGVGLILGGAITCLTVIGIPFGLQSIKLGLATFAPFGKEVRGGPRANSPLRVIGNVLWLVVFGLGLALNHLLWAVVLAITIIGLPFAHQHLKLIPLSLFPFGRDLVSLR